jgi:precorrin isomerase
VIKKLNDEELAAARKAAEQWSENMRAHFEREDQNKSAEVLRRERDQARGDLREANELLGHLRQKLALAGIAPTALRKLWDAIPKEVELPLEVVASVMFVLERAKEDGE